MMDALLFVGTSFSVGVTEMFLQAALFPGARLLHRSLRLRPHYRLEVLPSKAEELLPAVSSRLG